ncbi:Hsp70 family protein, partial [Candidatus Uhrbacteria bacterium]|nr:Hsp70 family protein [Candidatus Uhrbacteria bacterium]
TKLIDRNTTIPTAKTQVFSTAADSQSSVEIHILQGEREMAADNKTLGRFILDGIPPAPRGVPQVEVTFDLDANGILSVKAKDKATAKEQKVTITASTGLSKDEVERMKKEAELHADDDKKKRELAELRNNAEAMVYTTEKMLKEHGEKIPAADKAMIESKLEALKSVKSGEDAVAIRKAAEELTDLATKAGGAMYQKEKETAGAGAAPAPEQGEQKDGPIEADFKEKK